MRINEYAGLSPVTSYRKITLGTWRDAGDPSTYTWLDLDLEPARKFLAELKCQGIERVALAHLIAHAIATSLVVQPELNTIIRWRRLFRRPRIDAFHQVLLLGRGRNRLRHADQGGCTVRGMEDLTGFEQAVAHTKAVAATRNGETEAALLQKNLIPLIPFFLIRAFLQLSSFFIYALNIRIPLLGLTEDPFGSFIISDLAALGAQSALMPLPPYTRVGLLLGIGVAQKKAWVDDNGQVSVREVSRICITFDHRLADGVHLSEMQRVFCACMAQPEIYFPLTPRQAAARYLGDAKLN